MNRERIIDVLRNAQTVSLGACPICDADGWRYFGGRYQFDLRAEYWICPGCTLVGQSPMLNELVLQQFYREFYRELYQGNPVPTEYDCAFESKRGRNLLEIFSEAVSPRQIGNLLDVGSSTGALLAVSRSEFGANVAGIEPNEEYRRFSRENGMPVFASFDALKAADHSAFDVVTASHVLEHVADLHTFLDELAGLVRPGGFICLEVPHAGEGACFELLHLWGFNESSLPALLQRHGFATVFATTHGYPRSPDNTNLYLVIVAQRATGVVPAHKIALTARRASRQRFMLMNKNPSIFVYHQTLFKNTIKQMLGLTKGRLIAYSYFPSKLSDHRPSDRVLSD